MSYTLNSVPGPNVALDAKAAVTVDLVTAPGNVIVLDAQGVGPPGPKGDPGAPGAGFPVGGALDEVLAKRSGADYDTKWAAAVKPASHAPSHAVGGSDPLTDVVHLAGAQTVGGAKTFTATVQCQSYLIIGDTTASAIQMIRASGTHPGTGATLQGFAVHPSVPATTVTKYSAGYFQPRTLAAAFTLVTAVGLELDTPSVGAGSSITNAYGLNVLPVTTAATTNYGVAIGAATTQTLWLGSNTAAVTPNTGIGFGSARDTNLYRSAADTLKTDDKLIAALGVGVGNSVAATTPGAVVRKMEVFDAAGASLGFVPIYNTIT